ncbi:MAG: hypothetical protein ACR2F1_12655 [Nitrososphaeraceae archaeon]
MKTYQFILGSLILIFSFLVILASDNKVLGEPVFKDPIFQHEIIAEGSSKK